MNTAAVTREDFGDWLSPMVVKEIRQTLRRRTFVWPFVIFHGLLALLGIIGAALGESSQKMPDITGAMFWVLAGALLLVLIPMSGLTAIFAEKKANTLELLLLSGLSPWRIVLGKWAAVVGQELIVFFSMIPYVVLRYFLGGVALVEETQTILIMLGAGCVVGAVAVSMSALFSPAMRGLVLLILVVVGLSGSGTFVRSGTSLSPSGGGLGAGWSDVAMVIVTSGLLTWLALEFAAARIASPAENHALRIRLGAMAAAGLIIVLLVLGEIGSFSISNLMEFAMLVLMVVYYTAATASVFEPLRALPVLYRPMGRIWGLRAMMPCLFAPGWPSGLIFALLTLVPLKLAILWSQAASSDSSAILVNSLSIAGSWTWPLALYLTVFPKTKSPIGIYLGLHALSGLIMALVAAVGGIGLGLEDLAEDIGFIPLCGFLGSIPGKQLSPVSAVIGTSFSLLLLVIHYRRAVPRIISLSRAARALPTRPSDA